MAEYAFRNVSNLSPVFSDETVFFPSIPAAITWLTEHPYRGMELCTVDRRTEPGRWVVIDGAEAQGLAERGFAYAIETQGGGYLSNTYHPYTCASLYEDCVFPTRVDLARQLQKIMKATQVPDLWLGKIVRVGFVENEAITLTPVE